MRNEVQMATQDNEKAETNQEKGSWFDKAFDPGTAKSMSRNVFVIMPFTTANNRGKEELDYLFNNIIKAQLEAYEGLGIRFRVARSQNKLRINNEMIKDIVSADYVITDLSGQHSNPNVMYELGVRLAASDKPVILIRESNPDNIRIFDVEHLHIYLYDTLRLDQLTKYIIDKITAFETSEEKYVSPVLESIQSFPLHQQVNRDQAIIRLEYLSLLLGQYAEVIGNIFAKGLKELGISAQEYMDFLAGKLTGKTSSQDFQERCRFAEDTIAKLVKRPTNHAIGAYLADPFLDLLLPRNIAEQFYRVLSSYYLRYFGLNVGWNSNPPLLGAINFFESTQLVLEVLTSMQKLIEMGYEGPIDLDERRKGWIAEDHIVFALQVADCQKDLYKSYENLLNFISIEAKSVSDKKKAADLG
jgi:nucleoside 2-deoxyribosyltransferase